MSSSLESPATETERFKRELGQLWHSGWLYVGHTSEIQRPGDFQCRALALQPVILVRDDAGKIRVLHNRCRHRNVTVCRQERGHTTLFVCPDHGWQYNTQGDLLGIAGAERYAGRFQKVTRGLASFPRVEVYRNFIFASYTSTGQSLDASLGMAKPQLDQLLDHFPAQLEIVSTDCSVSPSHWRHQLRLASQSSHHDQHALLVFPNLVVTALLANQPKLSLRIIQPVAPDSTRLVTQHFG